MSWALMLHVESSENVFGIKLEILFHLGLFHLYGVHQYLCSVCCKEHPR